MSRRKWLSMTLFATLAAIAGGSRIAQAQTNAVATGNWSTPATWSGGVPSDSLSAAINGGFTVTVDQAGALANLLDVGTIAGQTGNINIAPGAQFGIFDAAPGTAPDDTAIRLGQAAGSTGNLTMTGGEVFIDNSNTEVFNSGDLIVGQSGTGTATISGGTLTAANEVFLGQNAGGSGTINLSGGELKVGGGNMLVGFGAADAGAGLPGGHGELNITGGTLDISGWLFSSFDPGTTSVINQTGGNVTMSALLVMGTRGDSTFNHTGGNFKADLLIVGDNFNGPGVHATYNISGTAKLESHLVFWVGAWGGAQGEVNQNGGTVEPGALTVGRDGMGHYNMNSGALTLQAMDGFAPNNHLIVGQVGGHDDAGQGTGFFTQTGGTVTVKTGLFLGDYDNSEGTYKISGGTLNVNGTGSHPNPESFEGFIGDMSVGGALASNARTDRVQPANNDDAQGQALDANGTFIVSGSAATINIARNFLANPADKSTFRRDDIPGDTNRHNSATLGFEIFDSSGTSLINVGGVADLDGAVIDIDLMNGFTPTVGATFSLLKASMFGATGLGTTQNVGTGIGFELAPEDVGAFSLAVVNGAGFQTLQATFLGLPMKPGDFNHDGVVDGADFLAWQRGGSPNPMSSADLTIWKNNFGAASVGAAGAVPEPTAIAMLLTSVAALAASRSRSPRNRGQRSAQGLV